MSALFSFLGGSVFRMLWGEISAFINKKQDHEHELEMLRLQADIEEANHKRTMEALAQQTALGIKVIEAKTEELVETESAKAFTFAMANAFKPTGIVWVDAWNGTIRPLAASIALFLWVDALWVAGFVMSDWDKELVGVILGFFFASRVLSRAGK